MPKVNSPKLVPETAEAARPKITEVADQNLEIFELSL
jgi:hypothetical protein